MKSFITVTSFLCSVALCHGSGVNPGGIATPVFSPVAPGVFPNSAYGIFPVGNQFYQAVPKTEQHNPLHITYEPVPPGFKPGSNYEEVVVPLPIGFRTAGFKKVAVPHTDVTTVRKQKPSAPLPFGLPVLAFKKIGVPQSDAASVNKLHKASVPLPIGFKPLDKHLAPVPKIQDRITVQKPHLPSVPLPVGFQPLKNNDPIVPQTDDTTVRKPSKPVVGVESIDYKDPAVVAGLRKAIQGLKSVPLPIGFHPLDISGLKVGVESIDYKDPAVVAGLRKAIQGLKSVPHSGVSKAPKVASVPEVGIIVPEERKGDPEVKRSHLEPVRRFDPDLILRIFGKENVSALLQINI